jgi:hypothetical protein
VPLAAPAAGGAPTAAARPQSRGSRLARVVPIIELAGYALVVSFGVVFVGSLGAAVLSGLAESFGSVPRRAYAT